MLAARRRVVVPPIVIPDCYLLEPCYPIPNNKPADPMLLDEYY
jgi:hypothetical protein